jgi:hypothetical protein
MKSHTISTVEMSRRGREGGGGGGYEHSRTEIEHPYLLVARLWEGGRRLSGGRGDCGGTNFDELHHLIDDAKGPFDRSGRELSLSEEREGRRATLVTVISSQCSGVTVSSASSVRQQRFR